MNIYDLFNEIYIIDFNIKKNNCKQQLIALFPDKKINHLYITNEHNTINKSSGMSQLHYLKNIKNQIDNSNYILIIEDTCVIDNNILSVLKSKILYSNIFKNVSNPDNVYILRPKNNLINSNNLLYFYLINTKHINKILYHDHIMSNISHKIIFFDHYNTIYYNNCDNCNEDYNQIINKISISEDLVLPPDFDADTYKELNKELAELTENGIGTCCSSTYYLSSHYFLYGKYQKRLYKLDLPDDFDVTV